MPSPGVNGETEASLSQRWPCLLELKSPASPCPVLPYGQSGRTPATSCPPGLSQLGARLTQTQHPGRRGQLPGGGRAGQVDWLVLRAGWRPHGHYPQGPEKVPSGALTLRPIRPCTGPGQGGAGEQGGPAQTVRISESLLSTDNGLADCSAFPGVLWDLRPWQLPAPISQPR